MLIGVNHLLEIFAHTQVISSEMAHTRLPNTRMLNIWLNIKNNSSRKRIKNRGMSCNRLCIPTYVVLIWGQKVISFCQIYISRKIGVPEFNRNMFIAQKVNMT